MKCSRTACQNQSALWYNHSTRAYYCEACAMSLNKIHAIEAQKLYGHDLCTLREGSRLISPNELLAAAKKEMLQGRDPKSREDQLLIMNFMVVNIQFGLRISACKLLNKIFNMNLSDNDIVQIVEYQQPFAVVASIPMQSYYVQENAAGLMVYQTIGPRIVVSKFDTKEEADKFQQVCQNHPKKDQRFMELLILLKM